MCNVTAVCSHTYTCTPLENEDFIPVVNGEILFEAGRTVSCGEVQIINDIVFENDELFYLTFSQLVPQERLSINRTMTTVTIKDDDGRFSRTIPNYWLINVQ